MYIQIERENIWQVYTKEIAKDGLLRGGGKLKEVEAMMKDTGVKI